MTRNDESFDVFAKLFSDSVNRLRGITDLMSGSDILSDGNDILFNVDDMLFNADDILLSGSNQLSKIVLFLFKFYLLNEN